METNTRELPNEMCTKGNTKKASILCAHLNDDANINDLQISIFRLSRVLHEAQAQPNRSDANATIVANVT